MVLLPSRLSVAVQSFGWHDFICRDVIGGNESFNPGVGVHFSKLIIVPDQVVYTASIPYHDASRDADRIQH